MRDDHRQVEQGLDEGAASHETARQYVTGGGSEHDGHRRRNSGAPEARRQGHEHVCVRSSGQNIDR